MIYRFDITGKLIDIHFSIKDINIKFNINESTIRSAIKKSNCVKSCYYFSRDKNFKLPYKGKKINIDITRKEIEFLNKLDVKFCNL